MPSAARPSAPQSGRDLAHAHGDGHDHGHDHGHHHGSHSHGVNRLRTTEPGLGRTPVISEKPNFSLMRLSAVERAGGAAVAIALVWTCVWWAVQ